MGRPSTSTTRPSTASSDGYGDAVPGIGSRSCRSAGPRRTPARCSGPLPGDCARRPPLWTPLSVTIRFRSFGSWPKKADVQNGAADFYDDALVLSRLFHTTPLRLAILPPCR
jgi:hypothetical protein